MDSHCPDSDLQIVQHSCCCDFQGMMLKATVEQAVQNLMRLDLVVKTSGHLTQTWRLSWSGSPVQKSYSTGDQVQPSENPDCTTGAMLWKPLPRAGIYWHFLFQFICANIRTIAAERLPRLYILISDRSNRSWPSLKWTIMELKLKWGWGAYCGLELEFLFHLDFFSSVSYSELRKIKTDTISNLVWTEPPGKRGVVLTLKSD